MKEWTKEQLYQRFESVTAEELERLEANVRQCPWRQSFHIQPPTGLLNDPNGLAFYQGKYHFFYQWFPLGPVHGLKYWNHVISTDMVNWQDAGIAIRPDKDYDNYGAYSGSGIVHDEKLYLMYTGNHRDHDWNRKPMQAIAVMDADGKIEKWDEAVIEEVPNGFTDHFRDPKVWKKGNKFYAIIGAQRTDETGSVVLYESTDLSKWTYLGEIDTGLTHFGYMWECPDYFELADRGILMFSPQGLDVQGDKYQNIYQSGYRIGNRLDMNSLKFAGSQFEELDNGFDFYAPQTFEDDKGRQILVGWMGLPDIHYPTDKNDWAHCLTLPRELTLVNGKLYQRPVKELEKLRQERHEFSGVINELTDVGHGMCYELICAFTQIEASEVGLNLRVGNHEKTVLKYDTVNKKIILDRSEAGIEVATEYGVTRKVPYSGEDLQLRIFVDTSSIEIFINDGESVMTSRIFPTNDENKIQVFSNNGTSHVKVTKWII